MHNADTRADEAYARLMSDTPERREHFKMLVERLSQCYGKDAEVRAVVLIGDDETIELFCANANDMEVADMVHAGNLVMHTVTMTGAPPKGMFN
jgi:hypothetical protein